MRLVFFAHKSSDWSQLCDLMCSKRGHVLTKSVKAGALRRINRTCANHDWTHRTSDLLVSAWRVNKFFVCCIVCIGWQQMHLDLLALNKPLYIYIYIEWHIHQNFRSMRRIDLTAFALGANNTKSSAYNASTRLDSTFVDSISHCFYSVFIHFYRNKWWLME